MDANPTSTMPAFRGSWHWEAVFQSQDDPSEVGMHLLLDGEYATPHQAEMALEEMGLSVADVRLVVDNGGEDVIWRAHWEVR